MFGGLGVLLSFMYAVGFSKARKHFGEKPALPLVRDLLWQRWKKGAKGGSSITGVDATRLDEWLMRRAKSLRHYWWLKDRGMLREARRSLAKNWFGVQADTYVTMNLAHLRIRPPDLHLCGEGGSSSEE